MAGARQSTKPVVKLFRGQEKEREKERERETERDKGKGEERRWRQKAAGYPSTRTDLHR